MPKFNHRRISEVLKEASLRRAKNKQDSINFIRENSSELMSHLVQMVFHPQLMMMLPETRPTYTPAEPVGSETQLYAEDKLLYTFLSINGQPTYPGLKDWKRQQNFIHLLERIHPEDAELLISVKNRKFPYPFLTYNFFKEAFPDWLPNDESQKD